MKRQYGRRHLLLLLLTISIGIVTARPASAHNLTMARGTTTCSGYCLSFTADSLTPGDSDKIMYTITLTPTAGGSPITVSGEVDFTAPDSGTFSISGICGNWLVSG